MATRRLLVTLAGIGVALLLGATAGAVSEFVGLPVVVTAAMALALGVTVGAIIRALRTPGALFASVLGGVLGVVAVGASAITDLALARSKAATEASASQSQDPDAAVRRWEAETLGEPGASAFLRHRTRRGAPWLTGRRLDLGTATNAVVFGVETLLAAAIAALLARRATSRSFCARCEAWFVRDTLGRAPLGSVATIVAAIEQREWHRLGRRVATSTAGPLDVAVEHCPTCPSGSAWLELGETEGRRRTILRRVAVDGAALREMRESQAMRTGA